ncbi:hypothetical protein [Microbacterium terrisoli]|uniref:hypothetical protein n=1 Tax=Microbacterium terrisoli TaxID=3242192 RepID=UPI00280543A7|nr:hypothetical protein [Microbacterium protaetiae]
MSEPTPANTVSISLTPITSGSTPPNIADDAFHSATRSAQDGGAKTQAFFDSMNQTADYWTWLTDTVHDGQEAWADGTDPQGNPIVMSSNGNLDVRMGAFYRAPASGEGHVFVEGQTPPITGLATIQTHNRTTALSSNLSFGLTLTGLPAGIVLSSKLFKDLIQPVYANLKTAVNKLSTRFRENAEVEDPAIDPEEVAEDPLAEASGETETIAGDLAEEGAEYLAVDWGAVGAEAAGLGVLAAIPMIIGFLGHKMINSVLIENMTDTDFTWSLTQEHGTASVMPDPKEKNVIPKMDYNTDSWGDKTTVKVAYQAQMQLINVNDFSSIGWVLGLKPGDGQPALAAVSDVPWAGDNIIWCGASEGSPDDMWSAHTQSPDGRLSVAATAGKYKVTTSISALHGETDGAFFYGTLVVIEPA